MLLFYLSPTPEQKAYMQPEFIGEKTRIKNNTSKPEKSENRANTRTNHSCRSARETAEKLKKENGKLRPFAVLADIETHVFFIGRDPESQGAIDRPSNNIRHDKCVDECGKCPDSICYHLVHVPLKES